MISEVYPADAIGPLYHEADLLTRPLELGPEVARAPEGPGLGVELDWEVVKSRAWHIPFEGRRYVSRHCRLQPARRSRPRVGTGPGSPP